jgi:hypothetical protein
VFSEYWIYLSKEWDFKIFSRAHGKIYQILMSKLALVCIHLKETNDHLIYRFSLSLVK